MGIAFMTLVSQPRGGLRAAPVAGARKRRRATAKLTRQKEALAEALEIVADDKRHAEMMKRMKYLDESLERNECD